MSITDREYLLDDDADECSNCGEPLDGRRRLCVNCQLDNADLYADMKIQDEQEG